jgi:regulator of protease activity HflC (stomatin/prohibitin superfamily)
VNHYLVLQTGFVAAVGLVLLLLACVVIYSAVEIIDAYEKRTLTVFGEFRTVLEPGLNFIPPFVSQTKSYDMRTQEFEVSADTATGSGTETAVATIQSKLDDVEQVFHEADDYRAAVGTQAEESLRGILEARTTESVEDEAQAIASELREDLEQTAEPWGIRIESVAVREAAS